MTIEELSNAPPTSGEGEGGRPAPTPPLEPFGSISDERAQQLLEQILWMRRRASTSRYRGKLAALAQTLLMFLTEGIGGWAALATGTVTMDEYFAWDVKERRLAIVNHTYKPLQQPGAAAELCAAMHALNGGQANELVIPTVSSRKGKLSYDLSNMQLAILAWMQWRMGRGEKRHLIVAEITKELDVSRQSLDYWRRALRQVFPEAHIRKVLNDAKTAGRIFRNPQDINMTCETRADAPAMRALWPEELKRDPYHLFHVDLINSNVDLKILGENFRRIKEGNKSS